MNAPAIEHAAIDAKLDQLGIRYRGAPTFIPASQFEDEWKRGAINFNCTIDAGHACIYRGPFAYGVGNLPGYCHARATKMLWAPVVADAIERGVWPHDGIARDPSMFHKSPPVPAPKLRDVMYSLIQDSDVLDAGGFESWAADYGYSIDSRAAEVTYRACLENALKLRAALGESVLAELRELFADY